MTLYFSMGLFLLNYIGFSLVTKGTLFLYPHSGYIFFLVAPGINADEELLIQTIRTKKVFPT